jgi:hypothetical protein
MTFRSDVCSWPILLQKSGILVVVSFCGLLKRTLIIAAVAAGGI